MGAAKGTRWVRLGSIVQPGTPAGPESLTYGIEKPLLFAEKSAIITKEAWISTAADRHETGIALHLARPGEGDLAARARALLGLAHDEHDLAVVEKRVQDCMNKLRTYQLSYPEEATEGMNRLAEAFITLTEACGQGRNGSAAVEVEAEPVGSRLAPEPPPVREENAETPEPIARRRRRRGGAGRQAVRAAEPTDCCASSIRT